MNGKLKVFMAVTIVCVGTCAFARPHRHHRNEGLALANGIVDLVCRVIAPRPVVVTPAPAPVVVTPAPAPVVVTPAPVVVTPAPVVVTPPVYYRRPVPPPPPRRYHRPAPRRAPRRGGHRR